MSWRTVVIAENAKLDYQVGYLVVRGINEHKSCKGYKDAHHLDDLRLFPEYEETEGQRHHYAQLAEGRGEGGAVCGHAALHEDQTQ